jgi:hypothetical protein
MTKGVILKGKSTGVSAYMEYKNKVDLPLSDWKKNFDIIFVKFEEDDDI